MSRTGGHRTRDTSSYFASHRIQDKPRATSGTSELLFPPDVVGVHEGVPQAEPSNMAAPAADQANHRVATRTKQRSEVICNDG